MKLQNKGNYLIEGEEKPIEALEQPDGKFYYNKIDKDNKNTYPAITESDVIRQVWLDRDRRELEVGDIVVYTSSSWNSSSVTVDIGQVEELKGIRATIRWSKDDTSKVAPHNLTIVSDRKIRKFYDFLK